MTFDETYNLGPPPLQVDSPQPPSSVQCRPPLRMRAAPPATSQHTLLAAQFSTLLEVGGCRPSCRLLSPRARRPAQGRPGPRVHWVLCMARTQDWRVNAAVCKEVLQGLGGFLASAQQAREGEPGPHHHRPSAADAQVDVAMQAMVRTPRPAPPCACP